MLPNTKVKDLINRHGQLENELSNISEVELIKRITKSFKNSNKSTIIDIGDDADDNCGSNFHDECGVCDGDNSSCADCAGTPNGNAYVDNCDVCDDDASNDCVQDCMGEWGGSAQVQTYWIDSFNHAKRKNYRCETISPRLLL